MSYILSLLSTIIDHQIATRNWDSGRPQKMAMVYRKGLIESTNILHLQAVQKIACSRKIPKAIQ